MATNRREYTNAWYQKNKEIRKAQFKRYKESKRLYLRTYKENLGCMDCGNKFPYYVLQLDHRDPSLKRANPADMVNIGWGFAKINEELAKCDVVCANCHAVRTHNSYPYSSTDRVTVF